MITRRPRTVARNIQGGNRFQLTIDFDDWEGDALCAQTDPDAFFPDQGGSSRKAKDLCLRCEVREECLEAALARDERWGIWGGLSLYERRALRRERAAETDVGEVA